MTGRSWSHGWFIITRLWQYFNLYFLKPFDAVNDTLTASLLHRLDWSGRVVELGSGDGVFSYVMHGGTFPLSFDRYHLTNLEQQGDIYDHHQRGVLRSGKVLSFPVIDVAVDRKLSHTQKIKEIGFAHLPLQAAYEKLPFADNSVEKIFYYTPHGLEDHERALQEAYRVLKPGGKLLMLLFDAAVKEHFVCHNMSKVFQGRLRAYFKRLGGGRFEEISKMSDTQSNWIARLTKIGFEVHQSHSGLSGLAWRVYDVQTRPILRPLIKSFNFFPPLVRIFMKLIWMLAWYPILLVFYIFASNDFLRFGNSNIYWSFELTKGEVGDQIRKSS